MESQKKDTCKPLHIHEEVVEKVKEVIPQEEHLYELADFFKMFGDTTRIKILQALMISEMCVCDISMLLHISQSAVSHQLKTLRRSKLVKFRKEGKTVFYSLDDCHIKTIIDMGLRHISE